MPDVKSPKAFRTISEVSEALDVPAHVLRFWETRFSQVRPVKRGGGRRYYRPEDVGLLTGIRDLLYREGLTIKGVQKVLREKGVRHVARLSDEDAPQDAAIAGPAQPTPAPISAPLPAPAAAPAPAPAQIPPAAAAPQPMPEGAAARTPETTAPAPSAAEEPETDPDAAGVAADARDEALRAALTRLEALQTRLAADPSAGMELLDDAAPPPAGRGMRRRVSGGA